MDRFDAMATLIATVDGGSLSAASRVLGMPLATVSRKVSVSVQKLLESYESDVIQGRPLRLRGCHVDR